LTRKGKMLNVQKLVVNLSTYIVRIRSIIAKRQLVDWVALALLALYIGIFSWMTIRQHNSFHTNALDLGKFDQMIWYASRGQQPYSTLTNQSFIHGHFSPIFALYAPLYWIWDNIRLLFILQSILLGSAGFLIYWFFREEAPMLGLAVFLGYLMHPSLHQVNLVEFRRITGAVLATSFCIYHLLRRNYGWMMLGLAIALLCKENMAFLAIGLGLYIMLVHHSFAIGGGVTILGVAWMMLIPFVVVPATGGTYRAAKKYFKHLGSTPIEMLQTIFQSPQIPLHYALRPKRWKAIFDLSWPTSFLFLLAPELAIFVAPFLGYLLISRSTSMGQLEAWYPSVMLPLLYWSVAVGVSRLHDRWRKYALIALLVTGLGGWFWLSDARPLRWSREITAHHRHIETVLRQIPREATVAAQDPLVPHLSHRKQIYLFPWIPQNLQLDYIVLDRAMNTYPLVRATYRSRFYDLLAGTDYDIEHQADNFYVFRYADGVSPAVMRSEQWGESFTLTGYSVAVAPPGEAFGPVTDILSAESTVRLSLFWRVDKPMAQNYSVFVHALNADGHVLAQHDSWPADAHRPTSVLPVGSVIRDVHYLSLTDAASKNDIVLHVGLYDAAGKRLLSQDGKEFVILTLSSD
jgi:uncharacterized membrane protein